MLVASFIGGDWGTSHLRLFLCDSQLTVLEQRDGPGANRACGAFENILNALIKQWTERHGELPVILSGMVGSSIGWVQTPYVPCPAGPEQIAASCIRLRSGRIRIVPGLSCSNRLGGPDFMRGEETQLLGALHLEPALSSGRHLVCLPGTHTKWVVLQDAAVQEFLTAPTGEIFASLSSGSTLVPSGNNGLDGAASDAFSQGLARIQSTPSPDLLHVLFECRSRRLSGELAAADTTSYLWGMLIGSDVKGALRLLADSDSAQVFVIGASPLIKLYSLAISALGGQPSSIDGRAAAVAGLGRIQQL